MANENPYLSVVIPQYNELSNLRRGVLSEVRSYLDKQNYSWEVIISDDGSSDNSYEFSEDFSKNNTNFRLVKGDHGGKAVALLNGINSARGEIILMTDMDQSTPLKEIEKLLPWFSEGYEVVIGSRGQKRMNSSITRKMASFMFSNFRRILLLRNIKDTQCGFKAFRSDILQKLFPKLDAVKPKDIKGWTVSAFDVELLYISQRQGYKIKEVTVEWNNEDVSETKDRKFVKESIDMLKQILKVRVNSIRGKYAH
jgi:dolichyl-phosphate beta-glucosyltransferase